MAESGFRLGIDFGTSNTVAMLRWPDGRTKPMLFDGSPLLPSAVYVDPAGAILTGRDAVHSARLQPHRFEPYPKRRIEERTVWLAEREIPAVELVASVLRRVGAEATRVAGWPPPQATLTHPAAWAPQRRQALTRAAVAAGLPTPSLSAEPVAAASFFVGTVGTHVPVGGFAVVYDFGAGTFDASVVRRNAGNGFDVLASEGLPDAGGLDVDAAVVAYLGRHLAGREGDRWHRLTHPENDVERRAAWQLWEDARLAKEMLSRAATTFIHVPLFDESVPIGREQLEELARPILDRTVTATQLAVSGSGLANGQLSAAFLVGGSSRIPLAATLLHRALGLAPTAIEQPELVVAEGALHVAPPTGRASVSTMAGPAPSSPAPSSPAPVRPAPAPVPVSASPLGNAPVPQAPAPPAARRRATIAASVGAGALVLVLMIAGLVYLANHDGPDPGDDPSVPAAAVAPACGYKIAFLGVSSGQASEDGAMMRDATRLAVEEFNRRNAACQVELVEYDTQNNDDVTRESATRIVDDPKVLGVVGPVYKKEILIAGPILEAAGVSMITPFAPDNDLSTRGWRVFHRVIASDRDQAGAGARYLKSIMRVARTYIVADDSDYGAVGKEEVTAALGDAAVGTVSIKRTDKDFGGAVKRVLDADPDGVYYAGQYDDGALFIKQLRTARPDIPIVASDRVFTQSFADSHGGTANGVVITCPCIPANQADRNFAGAFEERFDRDATYYGPEAYDAANIYLSGLRAGKASRDAMLTYVDGYDGTGVARSIKFSATGDLDVKSLRIWAYKVSGAYVEPDQLIPNE